MSFLAGAICKFNCCHNGRDLPDDNELIWDSSEMKYKYSCDCPHHFFLIISARRYNEKKEKDWSRIVKSEDLSYLDQNFQSCVAIPLDSLDDAKKLDRSLSEICLLNINDDAISKAIRPREQKEFETLSANPSAALCHKICRIRVKSSRTDTIAIITEECMDRVIEGVNKFLQQTKKELKINLKN